MPEKQILTDTQTEGDVFSVQGVYAEITLSKHSGGQWTVQRRTPDDEWIDTNIVFARNDVKSFVAMPGLPYRIAGGTAGATAWVADDSEAFRG